MHAAYIRALPAINYPVRPMKQFSIVTLTFFILISCSSKRSSETKTTEQSEVIVKDLEPSTPVNDNNPFMQYLNTLEKIPLPLSHNPLGELPKLSSEFDKNGFSNFKHVWCSLPLGILYQNNFSTGIVDCSIGDWGLVPFLVTYDNQGNKIDSTGFYKKSGMDMGYEAMEYLTFNKNITITVIDTVKRWDIDEEQEDIIEGSMKMTTDRTEYVISKSGKIRKK